MKSPVLFLLSFFLIVTGCAGPGWIKASRMNKLSLGMTKAEVLKILGEPHNSEARPGVDMMWYLEDEGGYRHQPYYVGFKDGKLDTYGPGKSIGAVIGGNSKKNAP
jgi:hypothetical protein